MLMQAEPVYLAYEAVAEKIARRGGENPDSSTENAESGKKKPRVVYLSPQGDVFSQKMAEEFAAEEDLILLCGHYEGIDERVLEEIVTVLRIDRRLCAYGRRTSGHGYGRCDLQACARSAPQ